MPIRPFLVLLSLAAAIALASEDPLKAVSQASATPTVTFLAAPPIAFPGAVDSNSPAFWARVDGRLLFHVMTSAQSPVLSSGPSMQALRAPREVGWSRESGGGRWMETVITEVDGTLYGYYHEEPADLCGGAEKTAPRIGSARSRDGGYTWEDLGIILEAPPGTTRCDTSNYYFVGGVGDFTAILDRRRVDLYFFFSAYSHAPSEQGVAVARMLWAERDTPQGDVAVWDAGVWRRSSVDEGGVTRFPAARPIHPSSSSWHDADGQVDAFWGPSIHWNTYLNQYVMLLNRAADSEWAQEGIYAAFSPVLNDPTRWTEPKKIRDSERWYPQVIGLEPGGTDRLAGQVARFFVEGHSDALIVFERPR